MKNIHKRLLSSAVITGLLFLLGCATTPSSHLYRLVALSEPAEALVGDVSLTIRLQSVILPGILHQPTVITQASPTLIMSSEFDRWAEPLEGQISAVLARNLAALLPGHNVVRGRVHPDLKADLKLHVEVLQFGELLGEQAQLDLQWSQSREGEFTELHRWQGQRVLESNDVQAYVLAQSELLAEASRTLAKHLSGHTGDRSR